MSTSHAKSAAFNQGFNRRLDQLVKAAGRGDMIAKGFRRLPKAIGSEDYLTHIAANRRLPRNSPYTAFERPSDWAELRNRLAETVKRYRSPNSVLPRISKAFHLNNA